jgi:predicted peptidase
MKKVISFTLLLIMLISCMSISSGAINVSLSQGKDALVAQWQKGNGNGFDYRTYSPVKGADDTTKYPLVVMLHGKYSGSKEGEQLTESGFYNWSSSEYQSRFKDTGGAFILMPRTPGGDGNTWANTSFHGDLMSLVRDYVAANRNNIDTSRIYLIGWSMGGAGAISVVSNNADFFAALVIIAPFDSVTANQVKALKHTPMWLVTCTKDTTASYVTFAKPFWNSVKDITEIPSFCRITTFSKYNYYDTGHHYTQKAVAEDLLNQPSDCGMKTQTARGDTIKTSESESIITWLSSQRLGQAKEDNVCHCNCHASKSWTKFWWAITNFFNMIFSPSKKMCACGKAHW